MATSNLWFFYRKVKENCIFIWSKKNLQRICKWTIGENPDFMSKMICDCDENQGLFKTDLRKRTFWYYTFSGIVLFYILFVRLIEKSATSFVNKLGWYYFWIFKSSIHQFWVKSFLHIVFPSSESPIFNISWKRWDMKIY